MQAVREAAATATVSAACRAFGLCRASWYRRDRPGPMYGPKKRRKPTKRTLTPAERSEALEFMNSPRFVNHAPADIVTALLEETRYLCSERTMYRILKDNDQVRERRQQLRHPVYARPELLATAPNQVWSWDITKLKGPEKYVYFHLYVIIDIFSRKVVGWMAADREQDQLAGLLIAKSCKREEILPAQLTIHADRGTSMTSLHVAQLLANLGVTKSHSRPQVSNDNPYSESHFRTMKYMPTFPKRFGCLADAQRFCRTFFYWYNQEHHHSGIAMLTPSDHHNGLGNAVLAARNEVMLAAYAKHPERFVNGKPVAKVAPDAAWINPPVAVPKLDLPS